MTDSLHDIPEQDRSTRPQTRTIIITLVALAVLLGGLFLWRSIKAGQGQGWQPQAVPVAAVVAAPRDVPAGLEAVGTLTAVREVTLSPEVAGRVSTLNITAGAQVRAGSLLVQLFDGPERADRQAAQARAAFASVQLARSEQLAPTGAEPRELLQQRRAERDQAVAAVRQIDARLVQKQVRAPFSGEIGIRRVNLGQYLNPGDPVATLTALDQLYVEFAVPQQELARLKPGSSVIVTSDAYPGRTFNARVNAVEPKIGEDTRNVSVQALLPNPGGTLRPGMYVTASLTLPPQTGAIVVPATAIQTSAQGDSVIVIRGTDARKGGKAEVVPVRTGRRVGNDVVIEKGLKSGDVAVSEGQLRVQPGAELKVAKIIQAGGR
ncbi:efflux RND transporter periplasmic adaptor subunit [Sphingobium lactosutens]|uniref:Hemolysin secretion protein D n=1 Tax=Sphingobium lactosutens DS20 TaxID=1331060 RepID=T0H413_9SPHN|nr:efflux RND transporter periplasmic adaptor subunit [Sphingobium lactosutens]EQB11116.1 hemolysin secretion protein D [Sphingobium lactosutens DS20]